jgi:phosphotransacetylase
MEAGRILVQQLVRLIDASAAGIVIGFKVPVILPGPRDDVRTSEAACALAALWTHFHEKENALRKIPQVRAAPLA